MDKSLIESIVRRIMQESTTFSGGNVTENISDTQSSFNTENATYSVDNITLNTANKLIAEVIKKGAEIGVKAVCAVVDTGARPVSVQSADGAFIASYDIALNKAYTSVSLKMKTSDLKPLAQNGGSLYGIQNTNKGQIVIFGGGVPLKINNKIVGGFGVSGGSEEQDTYLGEYAEKVFSDIL